MKTIEKVFVEQIKNILDTEHLSESNYYYLKRLVEIFNNENMISINLINLKDFSFLMDYFDYNGYNRGLLMSKIIINNFKIIDSKPYSKIDFIKYHKIYEERNISLEQFVNDVRNLVNSEDIELNSYKYEIFKMLQNEEILRLKKVKEAKEIKKAYEDLDIPKITLYLKSLNLSEKDISGVETYLKTLEKKEENLNINMDLQVKPVKLGYTKKEIKEMDEELNQVLNDINEHDIKISVKDYLKYVKEVLILEQNNRACDADIDRLYDALDVNSDVYSFLIMKAKSLLTTNKAIDIQNILQDIEDIESIMNKCQGEEKADFQKLLESMYWNLYNLSAYNHTYERSLSR